MTLEQYLLLAPITVNDLTIPLSTELQAHFRRAAINMDEHSLSPIETLDEHEKLMENIKSYGLRFNMLHMAAGMAGELLEVQSVAVQLMEDYNEELLSNLLEELTDIKWFCVVAAHFKGFQLTTNELDDVIEELNEEESESFEYNSFNTAQAELLFLNKYVIELADVIKRESCYGIAKYQKRVISTNGYKHLMYRVIAKCDIMALRAGLNPLEGMDKNIEKLQKVRYKDGFSTESATNRDIESEKQALSINNSRMTDSNLFKYFCREVYSIPRIFSAEWEKNIQSLVDKNLELEVFLDRVEKFRIANKHNTAIIDYNSGDYDEFGVKHSELDTILCSDGDNDYNVPKYKEEAFNRDVAYLQNFNVDLDEYYDVCETFDSVWGEYKI